MSDEQRRQAGWIGVQMDERDFDSRSWLEAEQLGASHEAAERS